MSRFKLLMTASAILFLLVGTTGTKTSGTKLSHTHIECKALN